MLVNFLEREEKGYIYMCSILFAFIILVGSLIGLLKYRTTHLSSEIKLVQKEVSQLKSLKTERVSSITHDESSQNEIERVHKLSQNIHWEKFFTVLTQEAKKHNIWFSSVQAKLLPKPVIRLSGVTHKQPRATRFLMSLKKNKLFKKVKFLTTKNKLRNNQKQNKEQIIETTKGREKTPFRILCEVM